MDVHLHAYRNTTTPLYNFVALPINLHDHTDIIRTEPNSVNYWLSEVVYDHSTTVDNIVPRGFFNGNPLNFIVLQLVQEGIGLGPYSPISARINRILESVPITQIVALVNCPQQESYFKRYYPNILTIELNFLELLVRSNLPVLLERNPNNHRRFLFINRRNTTHRTRLFSYLWRDKNFVDNSYTSFNPGTYWDQSDRMPDGSLNESNRNETVNGIIRDLKHEIHDIDTWLAEQRFPQLPVCYSSQNPFDYDFFGSELAQAHADTDINIITESNAHRIPQGFFSTEKFYRSVASHQAFIVYAQPEYYANIRKLGYLTYESIFNEKHDTIENDSERCSRIAKTVIALSRLDPGGFENVMDSAKRIRKHNYRVFMQRTSLATVAKNFTGPLQHLVKYLRYSPF